MKQLPIAAFLLLCILSYRISFSQEIQAEKKTFVFAKTDTADWKMDVYGLPANPSQHRPCIIFMFGGGFIGGSRDSKAYMNYFHLLTSQGYIVASIDYRLGLKGQHLSVLRTRPLKNAIDMAVEDLFSATAYLINNAAGLGIDTSKIILSGSSSGAISVMQGEWESCNRTAITHSLPPGFSYAGVIAFAGAIFSYSGRPDYKVPPAPIMMFHGTDDKLVFYNKKRFFNKGFFGSYALAKEFNKKKYPYYFQSVAGMGHEIAEIPMNANQKDILWFIEEYIFNKKKYLMDVQFHDLDAKRTFTATSKDIY